MPRQGVPYPSREICSLKCQIDALNAKINELMKSINGVQGDGQGDLTLVSGDPAIVINNDQAQHEIEIALDASQLPAAAVSSVNGQTGVVDLDGGDIPMYQGQSTPTVQNAVAANAGAISQLQADLNQEILDRGNADSALQSNINTVSAGLPAAAAAAVAADPTMAQLAVDVPNKLDKITSGSSLKAYTHTGATQGEKSVVDGTTADSIAIRDANGRLQAADPASGATDKTLTTANWVSQTGDSAPNNLVHRSATETIIGRKLTALAYNNFAEVDAFTTSRAGWHRFFKINTSQGRWCGKLTIAKNSNDFGLTRACYMEVFVMINSNTVGKLYRVVSIGNEPNIILTYNSTDRWEIWINCPGYQRTFAQLDSMAYVWRTEEGELHLMPDWIDVKTQPAQEDYTVYQQVVNP